MSRFDATPRNWWERVLRLHGRKFWLAFFAGTSSFVVCITGLMLAKFVEVEMARVIESMMADYLLAATGIVTAFSASSAAVERSANNNGLPMDRPQYRQSGMVAEVPDA